MTRNKTIGGRPITGDFSPGGFAQVEQWDEEKFVQLLDAVFDADPRVTAVAWREYTPYFNDGEPCYFSANLGEPALAFDKVPLSVDYDSFYDDDGEPIESKTSWDIRPEYEWAYDNDGNSIQAFKEKPSPLYSAVKEFECGLVGGHFDNLLLEHFGDHAEVIATREGFSVEYFEHD